MSSKSEPLHQSPQRFTLFGALRLLEAENADCPRLGQSRRPSQDPVRVGQQPHLWFAPADVTAYEPGAPGRLTCASFGLFGPNGALPLHLTEYADERERRDRDPTFTAFVDTFHHRMISLFYRAWADAQPVTQRDRPKEDRFATYLGALAGQGTPALRNRTVVSDLAIFHRAARFGAAAKPAEGLEDILSDYFGTPFTLESYVPRWLNIPRDERLTLGRTRGKQLGRNANLGGRSWQCQYGFRLRVGPLKRCDFETFLPGGTGLVELAELVRRYAGDELAWQLEIQVEKDETDGTCLGRSGRMAWNAWLGRSSASIRRVSIDGSRWERPARLAHILRQRAEQRVES